MQLLFFDTFSHDSTANSDLNLDLVQFPSPVQVKEVRVIPLGARVTTYFPGGGVRLGATNPTKFDLEFFVNNLRAGGASTFESIGLLAYNQNGSISMLSSKPIATDGLVLRGHYSAVTLAVYGTVSEPPPDPAARPAAAVAQTNDKAGPPEIRVKEEPVRPPESPLPDGNGRTIGERYAAVWTAKHSEEALKAEPPEEWMQPEADWQGGIKVEPGKRIKEEKVALENNNVKVEVKKEPPFVEQPAQWNRKTEPDRFRSGSGDRFRSGSRERYRSGSRDRYRSRSRERYRSGSRDRSPGYKYPARSREGSYERSRYRSRSRDRRRSGDTSRRSKSRDLRHSREGSREHRRSREGSRDYRRSREGSRDLRRSPEGSRDGRRTREGSRDGKKTREGSRESFHRRSYENSVKDGFRPRSRGLSTDRFRGSGETFTRGRAASPYRRSPSPRSGPPRGSPLRSGPPRGSPLRSARGSPSRSGARGRDGSPRVGPPRGREVSPRGPVPQDYGRDRSPRVREFSREREYDRTSHHSSGSRRPFSPRRSHTPRTLRSLSPRRRSLSPRPTSPPRYTARSRSRSPYNPAPAVHSPGRWPKRTYSPNNHYPPVNRPVSRNGHPDSFSPKANSPLIPIVTKPVPVAAAPVRTALSQDSDMDVLDNVSDISDVEFPEPELDDSPVETDTVIVPETAAAVPRNFISREDIEEISDDEAEWSDEYEPLGGFQDMDIDLVEGMDPSNNPITLFDVSEASLKPLRCLVAPQDTVYSSRLKLRTAKSELDSTYKSELEPDSVLCSLVKKLEVEEVDEKWIENLEQLTSVLQQELAAAADPTLQAVIKLAFLGLDYQVAMRQEKPTNKVRHIKSGVRFVLELVDCGQEVLKDLLGSGLVQDLWKLFHQEFMTIPTKLLILRVLDRVLDAEQGFKVITEEKDGESSFYSQLVALLGANEERTRTKFSLSSLVNKVHLYVLVKELKGLEELEGVEERLEAGFLELAELYRNLDSALSHPSRHLPCTKQFQLNNSIFNGTERGYFAVLGHQGVLELMSSLLERTVNHNLIYAIQSLIQLWMFSLSGLMFLASNASETNSLISVLLKPRHSGKEAPQSSEETPDIPQGPLNAKTEDPAEKSSLTSSNVKGVARKESGVECGVYLVHAVHAIQLIDTLKLFDDAAEDRQGMETSEVLTTIQALFSMTFLTRGREAVIDVLTSGDLMDSVLALTNHSSMDGAKDMKKSAVRGYANELLLLCVRSTENLDFLHKYSKELHELGKHDPHSKLSELVGWTRPCLQPLNAATIPELLNTVKRNLDLSTPVKEEVITSLRILANLAIPSYSTKKLSWLDQDSEAVVDPVDLKFNDAAILLYNREAVNILLALLDKFNEEHSQPNLHTATLVGSKGNLIIAVLKPAIAILRRLLGMVISVRGCRFSDLSPLGSLVKCFTLVSVVPSSSPYSPQAAECAEDIVSTLLCFTQPAINPDQDDLAKSLWTEMMREVLVHAARSPSNYIAGLSLVSRLLPLPLPLPVPSTLTDADRHSLLNSRKLWSAHLHPLQPEIQRIISDLSGFVYPPLLHLFRRVCDQLSGLGPPTASTVLLAVMRACLAALQSKNLVVSARMMGFLSWLCALPHLKAAMNTMLVEDSVRTEFCRTLELSITQGSEDCQESAIAVLQSLCDPELSLAAVGGDWESYLADSLPDRCTLLELMTVLLNPFTCQLRTNFSIQQLTMRTFIMFSRTDFTFSILKLCLNSKNRTLYSFLRNLSVQFEPGHPDCVPCLAAMTEFLALLVEKAEAGQVYPPRTQTLSLAELAWVTQYILPQEGEQETVERKRTHPLTVLYNRILTDLPNFPALQPIQVRLSELLERLEGVAEGVDGLNTEEEINLPAPSTLLTQWAWRPVTVPPQDPVSDQLSAQAWLTMPVYLHPSEGEEGREQVDLLDVAARYVKDVDLLVEVEEVCKETTLATHRKKKVKKSAMETKALQNKSIISTFKSGGSINLRTQRSFRGSFSRPDGFRARPPNTSRPPSLHVDDFLVLELKGQQPTGPTGYNKQSIKAAKELFAQREAEAALKPPSQLREATREPVMPHYRGRGRGGFRNSNGQKPGFRRDSRGWSPDGGFRTSEPRDLGREARPGPREDRRFRGRGERRGWDRGGRGRDRGGGRGKDRDDRRHGRNFTR